MRPSTRRPAKRGPLPTVFPSSASIEFISVSRENGRITKKRVVEKAKFNAELLDDPALDDTPYLPLNADVPQADTNSPAGPKTSDSKPKNSGPSRAASTKLSEWLPYRPKFLTGILRLEAPCSTTCVKCKEPAVHRCMCCFPIKMKCRECLLSSHDEHPLHYIQEWNGKFFEETSLTALGLVIQLGHEDGICVHPSRLSDLMVFDSKRISRLVVRYCKCGSMGEGVPRYMQLLQARWFPATIERPSTAFTFDLLDYFHTLQNRNKCNPYDFYLTITQLTDAAGLGPGIYRYNELTLVFRTWCHLQLLKRGGAGYDSSDIESALDGSLAVVCPACPHPGKNTIELPEHELWKNTLFIGVDACFKLKSKDRGFDDPELGSGLAYMASDVPYKKHLKDSTECIETISTCGSDLHAVNQAYTKHSQGYIATGVAVVSCRHAFVLPNGVVDLQKGERHVNIDYAVASSLAERVKAGITDIVVSYDIGCQWGKNFRRRLSTYPSAPLFDPTTLNSFRVAVPKFHLKGHGASCQSTFNLAFMDNVGMTHGESVETIWSHSTSLATWSRENGPGARHLILDDHWAGWNWSKLIGLRSQLKAMLERACKWAGVQRKVADLMTVSWLDFVPEWRKMWRVYKQDNSKPNPFEEPDPDAALIELRAQLAKEDSDKRKAGAVSSHEMTPSMFIQRALEIETAQRRFKVTDDDDDDEPFYERRRALSRNINTIREPQQLYMKGVRHLIDKIDPILLADHPENVQLWLPSELPPSVRDEWCTFDLPRLEYRLRYATALSALEEIRRFRRYYQAIVTKTRSHIANTQKTRGGRGQLDRVQQRITRAAATYWASWSAIRKLAPNEEFGRWKNHLQELRQEDIRGPGQEDFETSQSRHLLSWIWWSTPAEGSASDNDRDFCASVRVEWCRAQARAERFEEEIHLVVEEMRRTLAYFECLSCEWENRATLPSTCDAGISAYAHKQAAIYRGLVDVFVGSWYWCLKERSLGASWLCRYPPPPPVKRGYLVSNVRKYHSASVPPADLPDDIKVDDDVEELEELPPPNDPDFIEELLDN